VDERLARADNLDMPRIGDRAPQPQLRALKPAERPPAAAASSVAQPAPGASTASTASTFTPATAAVRGPLKPGQTQEIIPFTAGDGMPLNLIRIRGESPPTKGPVVLVHGAGVRGDLFRPPVDENLVDYLVKQGYDVFLENWRASIDVPKNAWTLDQAAVHDHPAAVKKILEVTGQQDVKAIVHCQGSTSFMMAAAAGLLPNVSTIVSNAVSLHPEVPKMSEVKLDLMAPVLHWFTDSLNPQWGRKAEGVVPRVVDWLVQVTHPEDDSPVGKQISFTYGAGPHALWDPRHLNPATKEWLTHEFGSVPSTFFEQMDKSVDAGKMVSTGETGKLPKVFGEGPPQMRARVALIAGENNNVFLPESQRNSYAYLKKYKPDTTLHVLKDYGHLDVFMGKDAARDVFPMIAAELERGPS
jgi:pimeloyl-ACP methyl ester carboxylesterase